MVEWRSLVERFRTSLFGLPSVWIAGSVGLWLVMRELDDLFDPDQLPGVLETTVDSARALLGAVASGTIAAASVVFSLTLVAIQLSSNAYSSRVLRTFLRDRFQQNMMGIVLATFSYSLLVLRDVRGPIAEGGDAHVPSVSVTFAVILALAAILALLASISHTSQSVRVSRVSSSVREDTRTVILAQFGPPRTSGHTQVGPADDDLPGERGVVSGPASGESAPASGESGPAGRVPFDLQAPGVTPSPLAVATGETVESCEPPADAPLVVAESVSGGWVQQVSVDALVDALDGVRSRAAARSPADARSGAGSEPGAEAASPPNRSAESTSGDARVVLRLEVAVGTYVSAGAPLVTLWRVARDAEREGAPGNAPDGGNDAAGMGHDRSQTWDDLGGRGLDELRSEVLGAIRVGPERTMQQDIAFGLTMLEDIALRALSPGINDPNTAGAIIPQLGELLLEIMLRDLPPTRMVAGDITIVRPAAPGYLDYIEAAFGQIRRVSADQPAVRLTMMRTLATIASELERRGVAVPEVTSALRLSMRRLVPDTCPGDDPAVVAANELLAATDWFATTV